MSSLIVFCTRCRREVRHGETRDGLCVRCRVEDATRESRAEVKRLQEKQRRYRARGTDVTSLERQLDRARQRLVREAYAVQPDKEALAQLLSDLE